MAKNLNPVDECSWRGCRETPIWPWEAGSRPVFCESHFHMEHAKKLIKSLQAKVRELQQRIEDEYEPKGN